MGRFRGHFGVFRGVQFDVFWLLLEVQFGSNMTILGHFRGVFGVYFDPYLGYIEVASGVAWSFRGDLGLF